MSQKTLRKKLTELEPNIANALAQKSDVLLRWSLGIIFIWFGILKPFHLSPAAELVEKTVFWWPPEIFIPLLGWWEVLIGIGFIIRPLTKVALILMALQMSGTFLPFIILPHLCFGEAPLELTLTGQYVVKNLILISGAIAVAGNMKKS